MTWMEKQTKEETTLLNVKNPQSVCHDLSSIERLYRGGLSVKSKAQMRWAKRMIQYLARRIQYRESNLERTWYEDSAIRTSKLWGIQDEAWSHYEEPNMRKPKNNIFSELYFDQYEVSVNAKNIRYFEVEEHPLIKVNSLLIIIFKIFVASRDIP